MAAKASSESLKQQAAAVYKWQLDHADELETSWEADFFAFLTEVCFTFDAHEPDPRRQSKLFPKRAAFREICDAIQKSKLVSIFKSRQVMMSWVLVCYALWLALYRGGAAWVLLQSRKEEDAIDLLKRLRHVYGEFPPWLQERHPIARDVETEIQLKPPKTGGPGARITAVPQGAHVVRSRTATCIIADECAVQEELAEAYTASRPAVMGGGQWIGCGTPNGREFGWMLFSDHPDTIHPQFSRQKREVVEPVRGLEIALNRNGFVAIRAHYTMLPERDPRATREGAEWFREAKQGIPEVQWRQEQEIDFDVLLGSPVYADYKPEVHSRSRLDWVAGPVLRGWDYGYRRPACVWAQQTADDRLMFMFELLGRDVPIQVFADAVLWCSGQNLTTKLNTMTPDFVDNPDEWVERQVGAARMVHGARLDEVRGYADGGHFEGYASFADLPRFTELTDLKFIDWDDPAGTQKGDKGERSSREILQKRGIKPKSGELRVKTRIDTFRDMLLPRRGDDRPWIIVSRAGCPILHRCLSGGYCYRDDKEIPDKNYYSHLPNAAEYLVTGRYNLERELLEPRSPPKRSFAGKRKRDEMERIRRSTCL